MTTPWSSETSWTVSRGSLDSVVTFETFDFPIESDSTRRKPPLLLLPPSSPDFQPCEIKLNFTQKHEIRQVYVRSTARIYEIYYAPALQSDNEYLCTVRCSAASAEDDSFPASDVKEAISINSKGPSDRLPKARVTGDNKVGTNEDDWIEVKLPVGPDQNSNSSRNHQDFYEATAEINDSEPCMSLTVRLLSLHTKGCVYVDEVYVFADPIDSNESENQTLNAEASAGSSLMTMLVPTLIGLTKSRSVQLHDQNNSNPVGKSIKTGLEPTSSSNPVNLVHQQDETLKKPSEAKAELTRSQLPVSIPDTDKVHDWTLRNEFSYTRAEVLLEQLVTRVRRIEDICMRFEENMLKPLNNIEARLQSVEQQIELLGRCAVSPSVSELEPDLGSCSTGTHKPPDDTSMSTVHVFPCCDEKVEANDVLVSPKKGKPKKTVSIDDALAAALAGFSSFTKLNDSFTVETIDHTTRRSISNDEEEVSVSSDSLKASTPEFIGEENDEDPTSGDVSIDTSDDSFDVQGISQVYDEEAMGPTGNFSCPSSPHEIDTQQESIKGVKLAFDKADILKHFPDQPQDVSDSIVDFESPILEVKFASFENSSLKSPLEALLTNDTARPDTDEGGLIEETFKTTNNLMVDLDGDDTARPDIDEGGLIEETFKTTNNLMVDLDGDDTARPGADEGGLIEERFKTTNNLMVDLDGDDAAMPATDADLFIVERSKAANNLLVDLDGDDVSEDVQQGLPPVQLKASFESLI